jgi:hypothetical protein
MTNPTKKLAKETSATKKERFIKELAIFLAGNPAGKSISLEVEAARGASDPRPAWAREWATLRGATPLFGYQPVEEAEDVLTDFLA